jgi:hypothetical protein
MREVIDITVQLHHRTEKAVLVSDTGDEEKAVWLPLSQIEIDHITPTTMVVTLPVWLAKDKGLA